MDSAKLHDWLQILGVFGVIAGLVFLGYEIRQNHELMKAQTRQALAQSAIDLLRGEAENGELASIVRRGNAGEELSDDEFFRYRRANVAFFAYWENVFYQYEAGLIDDSEFIPQRRVWQMRTARPGIHKVWCLHRETFSPRVVAEVEGMMSKTCTLDDDSTD